MVQSCRRPARVPSTLLPLAATMAEPKVWRGGDSVDSTRTRTVTTRSLSHGASAAVTVVGAATLLGWWLDIEPLKRGIGDAVAMNPATAICFILTGASLWLARAEPAAPWTRRVAASLAASVALVAIVRLAGYV